jgi:hypothetical protein
MVIFEFYECSIRIFLFVKIFNISVFIILLIFMRIIFFLIMPYESSTYLRTFVKNLKEIIIIIKDEKLFVILKLYTYLKVP